ncbi:hypothetical protein SLEP1_g23091 [Rubroshorea leprosula]|uniref:Uncharacterized protein n=1 Tax=Rubroshorea leprosula TaxID=152421 RepID=A0AAV5JB99_9ROSI|nr:hypothetical protein SLEP1_g23091 [Rubroshorea leprosula]
MMEPPCAPSSDDPSGLFSDLAILGFYCRSWEVLADFPDLASPDWISAATSWRFYAILSGVN